MCLKLVFPSPLPPYSVHCRPKLLDMLQNSQEQVTPKLTKEAGEGRGESDLEGREWSRGERVIQRGESDAKVSREWLTGEWRVGMFPSVSGHVSKCVRPYWASHPSLNKHSLPMDTWDQYPAISTQIAQLPTVTLQANMLGAFFEVCQHLRELCKAKSCAWRLLIM